MNRELFKFCGKSITPKILKEEKWLRYLYITEQNNINLKRVNSIAELSENQVIKYVERTLEQARFAKLKGKYKTCLIRALQWSEVAKCGSEVDRKRWLEQGFNLEIHNEASAEIYLQESADDLWTTKIVYTLIKTHGMIGQYIQGEVNFSKNAPLVELINTNLIAPEHLRELLYELNKAIITGVSPSLWRKIEKEVNGLIKVLCEKTAFLVVTEITNIKNFLDVNFLTCFFGEHLFIFSYNFIYAGAYNSESDDCNFFH
jgi:hypothetical protein